MGRRFKELTEDEEMGSAGAEEGEGEQQLEQAAGEAEVCGRVRGASGVWWWCVGAWVGG